MGLLRSVKLLKGLAFFCTVIKSGTGPSKKCPLVHGTLLAWKLCAVSLPHIWHMSSPSYLVSLLPGSIRLFSSAHSRQPLFFMFKPIKNVQNDKPTSRRQRAV
jgi:hypothetical protein